MPRTPKKKAEAMRKILILSMPILLAGCVNDTASYLIDGASNALTVRREQPYFWKGEVDVSLVATRLPDCQRLHALASAPKDDMKVELFNAGEGLWNVHLGDQLWQVSTQNCNDMTELQYDPKADMGQAIGTFVVHDGKLEFDAAAAAVAASADTAAPAPAAQQ
jgi:hypothetical protein